MPRLLAGLVLSAHFIVGSAALAAAGAPLPPDLQAAVIEKILGFDRTLGVKARRILVVHGDSLGHRTAVRMVAALQGQGMEAKAVPAAELQGEPAPVAVYLASPAGLDKVQRYCVTMKVLSMAQDVELVKGGNISVAVAPGPERNLEIWIHLSRSRSEWQDLAAELLQVARVIH